jgi:hypothetical protein
VSERKREEWMRHINRKKNYLFYPDQPFSNMWDMVMTLTLLFTSIATPMRMAFYEEDDWLWMVLNYLTDGIFFLDILYSFNLSFMDDDFNFVHDRKRIACVYLKTWFLIDVISIFPFELALRESQESGLSKFT